jgi:putative transposase
MARKVRVEFEGALYHVMCRGDRRENIFEDDTDRVRFMETLSQACQRTGWKLHAYVLMSNHYHWLLETPHPNLVAGMRWFQSCFTARYNRRHRKAGHLFQGRYKAMLVEPGQSGYFAAVSDYIHLNPARAGVIGKKGRLRDYRWSSLPSYLGSARGRPPWLEVSMVLGELGLRDGPSGRRAYGKRMENRGREGMSEAQLKEVRRGWVLGGEAFRERVLDWMERKQAGPRRKLRREESDRDHGQRHAERIIKEMLGALGISERQLLAARKGDWGKRVIAHRVRQETSVSLGWLAGRLKMGSEGHVSRMASSLRDLTDPSGRRLVGKALRLERNARKKD